MKWIEEGRLEKRGQVKMPSGRWAIVVDESDFAQLAAADKPCSLTPTNGFSLITIIDACLKYQVDERTALGWLKGGKLEKPGRLKLPSGQRVETVDEGAFATLAASATQPPPMPAGGPSPTGINPVTLGDACKRHQVNLRTAMRWMADGDLKSLGRVKMPSGQRAYVVDDGAFAKLADERNTLQVSKIIYNNARAVDCNPACLLECLLKGTHLVSHGGAYKDIDLAYAAIQLALDPKSRFFEHLCHKIDPCYNFAHSVAKQIQFHGYTPRSFREDRKSLPTFQEWFKRVRVSYSCLDGCNRDLINGSRPAYLKHLEASDGHLVPGWATKAVWPIRQTQETQDAYWRMGALANKKPSLKKYLVGVNKCLAGMSPSSGIAAADMETRDPFVVAEIKPMVAQLERLGVERRLAQKYCYGKWRLFQHQKIMVLKGLWEEDYHPDRIPAEILDRIFGGGYHGTEIGRLVMGLVVEGKTPFSSSPAEGPVTGR